MAKDNFIPRDELLDMNEEFNKVRAQVEKELMEIPGVLSVGVGLKEVKGQIQQKLCFKVTVERKKQKNELKPSEMIPPVIYGFETDVIEMGEAILTEDYRRYRPLVAGTAIGVSNSGGYGSFGCLARRNADNKIVLLSNWHVLVNSATNINGERVGQPSHNGCCKCCECNEIGVVTDGVLDRDFDAAIALLHGQDADTTPDERYINEILEIGYVAGSAAPVSGEVVYKRGARTGFTKGQISNDNAVFSLTHDIYNNLVIAKRNQLAITPTVPAAFYSNRGDSGSVSVNELNQAVGLNFAGATNGSISYSQKMPTVTARLNITILDSSFHGNVAGKEGVLLSTMSATPVAPALSDFMGQLETELLHFREGRRMLELFKTHHTELLDLVNHKREVMAAWNRYQGPSYLAHIARSVIRENKPVPGQIKGITLQSLLLKMTAVLQRNGSPELAKAVTENYLSVMQVLSAGPSLDDWRAELQRMENIVHH